MTRGLKSYKGSKVQVIDRRFARLPVQKLVEVEAVFETLYCPKRDRFCGLKETIQSPGSQSELVLLNSSSSGMRACCDCFLATESMVLIGLYLNMDSYNS